MLGFLNVNKPIGLTSHDVVAQVRRRLQIKKVGHAGTLDPLATGVLVLCLGAATRLSEYVMHSTKRYQAQIRLGVTTTTYDSEGEITAEYDPSGVTQAAFENALSQFFGDIEQIPPMYSAIKQGGRKLYDLARAGQVVERQPRPVQITALQLVDWSPPQVTIDVECSVGTYIRSLAHDLGAALGVGAHLTGLIRAASGTFTLDTAVDLDTLLNAADWQRYLIGPEVALAGLPVLRFDVEAVAHLQQGRAVSDPTAAADRVAQAYGPDGELVAIIVGGSQCWHPHKVFKGSES